MKKIVFILVTCLMSLSLSSFDTNRTGEAFLSEYEMYIVNCHEIAIATYPVYYEQADGDNAVASIFAEGAYDSCIRNGGAGGSWSTTWLAIRFAYPQYF